MGQVKDGQRGGCDEELGREFWWRIRRGVGGGMKELKARVKVIVTDKEYNIRIRRC